MYAVVRTDLAMSAGKSASQAGHAFLDSFIKSPPEYVTAYRGIDGGTKVVLGVDGEARLREIVANAERLGLPCALVEDDGVATAAGIGPAPRDMIRPITRRLSLMR